MRLLAHAVAVLVGAAVGVASVTVHRSVVLGLPVGLLLALATTFVTAWAVREILRRLTASYAAGWLIAFGAAVFGRSEGDYAVASDGRGYALIAAAVVLVVVGVASLASPDPSSRSHAT